MAAPARRRLDAPASLLHPRGGGDDDAWMRRGFDGDDASPDPAAKGGATAAAEAESLLRSQRVALRCTGFDSASDDDEGDGAGAGGIDSGGGVRFSRHAELLVYTPRTAMSELSGVQAGSPEPGARSPAASTDDDAGGDDGGGGGGGSGDLGSPLCVPPRAAATPAARARGDRLGRAGADPGPRDGSPPLASFDHAPPASSDGAGPPPPLRMLRGVDGGGSGGSGEQPRQLSQCLGGAGGATDDMIFAALFGSLDPRTAGAGVLWANRAAARHAATLVTSSSSSVEARGGGALGDAYGPARHGTGTADAIIIPDMSQLSLQLPSSTPPGPGPGPHAHGHGPHAPPRPL